MDDEEYDIDEIDETEDFDEEELDNLDDLGGKDFNDSKCNLGELEELGIMDGQQDAISGSFYTGFGLSVDDLEDLSDEERDAYEAGYHTGFGAGGGWDK